jgi:murein DD-endopeptidase MepM/ murein hydrolase activator NlpD
MTLLAWPLERNHIRQDIRNNAFGMVRNGGTRAHQGWDLYAAPGTPCYAIADGKVPFADYRGDYGNTVLLEFSHRGQTLYAMYCHLSTIAARRGAVVRRGEMIGLTGNTGNAKLMHGEDQHLHFEIRTSMFAGQGLDGRIDPARLYYGIAPIGWTFFEGHGQKALRTGGLGLRVRGVNMREYVE